MPTTAPALSMARNTPKCVPRFSRVERSEMMASRGAPRILPERSRMRNGMTHPHVGASVYPTRAMGQKRYPIQTKTLRFFRRSERYPEKAWENDTTASPRPSMRPTMDMFAPRTVVRKRGHTEKIMSAPTSWRKEARENVPTVLRTSRRVIRTMVASVHESPHLDFSQRMAKQDSRLHSSLRRLFHERS